MNIHVRLVWDEHGTREFIIFETGKFSTPIMILTEEFAENFLGELQKAIDKSPHKVREIK